MALLECGKVERQYEAIVLGAPKQAEGTVETNIGRDVRDRKKMGVFPYLSSRCAVACPCAPQSGRAKENAHFSSLHRPTCGLEGAADFALPCLQIARTGLA